MYMLHDQMEGGNITPIKEVIPPQIPEDLNIAIKSGKVRAPTHIISTISDDRGMDLEPLVHLLTWIYHDFLQICICSNHR